MPESRLYRGCLALMAGGLASAGAQTVDRTLSVTPDPSRPLVIIAPARSPPPAPVAAPARSGVLGSYAADAPGPDIRAGNVDYVTSFAVVGQVPAGATITRVAWRYAIAAKPPGFEAVLCWKDAATCWNVTKADRGDTHFFNGRDASLPFTLHYRVRGSGTLAPLKGEMNQIIVTYDVPR